MLGWELIQSEQPEIAHFLSQSYQKDRLLHAYIFEGPQGVKKLETAKMVAKMLLCESEEKVCHTCRHCQLIDAETHANVSIIRKDGQSIKKEQIQLLQAEFSKTAVENSAKLYIIEDADKMSVSAANSLLKFLEEPAANTYALLLTLNKQKLLPTIRSRAVTLTFKALSQAALTQKYEEAGVTTYAPLLATLTQNIDEGVALAKTEEFMSLVTFTLKTIVSLTKKSMDPTILIAQENTLLKEKEHQILYLKLLMIYFEDILNVHLQKDNLRFKAHEQALIQSAKLIDSIQCIHNIQLLLETEKRIVGNANVLLSFDQMFYKMKGGK